MMNRRSEENVEDGGMTGVLEDYESMIGARKLRVRRDEKKGKQLIATEMYSEGDTVLRERPLIGLQSIESKMQVPVCAKCFRFIGNAELHYDIVSGRCSRSTLRKDDTWRFRKETTVSFRETNIVQCACGECFCSETCRKESDTHALLCTASVPDDHPIVKFKIHAMQTNEIFLLAAKVVASIIVRALKNHKDPMKDYRGFVRRLWWDVVVEGENSEEKEESSEEKEEPSEEKEIPLRDILCDLTKESLDLLRKGLLNERSESESRVMAQYLTLDFYGRIIGMFEQNQISIDVESPLSVLLRETRHDETKHKLNELLLRAVDDSEFPSLTGTAMFALTCGTINHSCDPNVSLTWDLESSGVPCIELKALRDIQKDEEICFSYIDEDMSFEDRRAVLMDYGFVCECAKCLRGD